MMESVIGMENRWVVASAWVGEGVNHKEASQEDFWGDGTVLHGDTVVADPCLNVHV